MSSFQQVTQQADAKASTLVAIYVGLSALLAARVDAFRPGRLHGVRGALVWPATGALVAVVLITGYFLVQVLRPRAAGVPEPNPFSLVQAAGTARAGIRDLQPTHALPPTSLAPKAWEVANALARIALLKNQYIGRALTALALMVVIALAWLSFFAAGTESGGGAAGRPAAVWGRNQDPRAAELPDSLEAPAREDAR